MNQGGRRPTISGDWGVEPRSEDKVRSVFRPSKQCQVELLHGMGVVGSLEDLVSQAKCQQLCKLFEGDGEDSATREPRAKRARKDVWTGLADGGLAEEDAFDGDALLSGELGSQS
jgi:hypothetical protein